MAGDIARRSLTAPVVVQGTVYEPPPAKRLRASGKQIKDVRKRQSYFLGVLAETASVADACHYVGATRVEVSEWRRDPAFEVAWNEALRLARSVIVDTAVDRAVNGAPNPIVTKAGEVTGWFRKPSDGLLTTLLQNPHLMRS